MVPSKLQPNSLVGEWDNNGRPSRFSGWKPWFKTTLLTVDVEDPTPADSLIFERK